MSETATFVHVLMLCLIFAIFVGLMPDYTEPQIPPIQEENYNKMIDWCIDNEDVLGYYPGCEHAQQQCYYDYLDAHNLTSDVFSIGGIINYE